MKYIVICVAVVFILSVLLSACMFLHKEVYFSEVQIGENFFGTRDGHFTKLPNNYCLAIIYRSTTGLFKVSDEFLEAPFAGDSDHAPVYNTERILEGHYIRGYYNDKFVVLCEEKSDGSYVYLSFEFSSEEVRCYSNVNEVYEVFEFDSSRWFSLCNTSAQIIN